MGETALRARNRPGGRGGDPGRRCAGVFEALRRLAEEATPLRRSRLLLAMTDLAPHPALLATHLAATFSTAATGHTRSSACVDWTTDTFPESGRARRPDGESSYS